MANNPRFSILQGRAVRDARITDAQFRTLAALGLYTDDEGWCWPSLTTLGKDVGKSKQAAGRDVLALKKLDYLEIWPQYKKDGSRTVSKYRLKFDLPRQPEVDTPSTPEVDTPSTPEVDENVPLNVPKKKDDLVDLLLQTASPKELAERVAIEAFEKAFGFGELPWYTAGSTWDRFRRFVAKAHQEAPDAFGAYVAWRNGEGKFVAMSNVKIRQNPQIFMDTSWTEFIALHKPAPARPAGTDTLAKIKQEEAEAVPPPAWVSEKAAQMRAKYGGAQ